MSSKKPEPTHLPGTYVSAKEALKGVEQVPWNNERLAIKERTEKIISLIPPGGNFTDIPPSHEYYVKGVSV